MLNPSQLDMGIPTKEKLTFLVDGEELAANIQMQYTAYQLDNYQIKSPNKTGMDIFNHIIQFRKENNKSDCKPSSHLIF